MSLSRPTSKPSPVKPAAVEQGVRRADRWDDSVCADSVSDEETAEKEFDGVGLDGSEVNQPPMEGRDEGGHAKRSHGKWYWVRENGLKAPLQLYAGAVIVCCKFVEFWMFCTDQRTLGPEGLHGLR